MSPSGSFSRDDLRRAGILPPARRGVRRRSSATVVPERVEREVRRDQAGRLVLLRLVCLGAEPPGLNSARGLLRRHWTKRGRDRDSLLLLLRAPGPLPSVGGPARVAYSRTYARAPLDPDNLAASAKPILDALVRLGVLVDDSPAYLELAPEQERRGRGGPRYVLEISPRDPPA